LRPRAAALDPLRHRAERRHRRRRDGDEERVEGEAVVAGAIGEGREEHERDGGGSARHGLTFGARLERPARYARRAIDAKEGEWPMLR
jgi:hypothetical protein